ncbi:MAG: FecR family protein [Opitutaceae bacterium]
MHNRDAQDSAAELERTATEWFFRRDGGFDSATEKEFARWLGEDQRHAQAFAKIEGTWSMLGEARSKLLPAALPLKQQARKVAWCPIVLGAAAVIAISFLGWQRWDSMGETFVEQVATEVGGLRKMDLPDGSFVKLNTNSAVDVRFMPRERRVRLLRGEAHFAVSSDPVRPFIVEAGGVAVQAVGTVFNVRMRPDVVEVLVTEGKVRVDDPTRGESLLPDATVAPSFKDGKLERLLLAGEKAVVSIRADAGRARADVVAISPREIDHALAWQNRRIDYVDAPLVEIVTDFNRYNQHQLVIVDPELAQRRFGGSFPAGDYASFVQLLETTFDVDVERRDRETLLRLR